MIQFTIPSEISFHRQIIDEGFPAAPNHPECPPGSIDIEYFLYIWADFTLWLDYPWVVDVNDELEDDLTRRRKLFHAAKRFRLTKSDFTAIRANLIQRWLKDRRKHTRIKPTPHIVRLRRIIDESLTTVSDSNLKRMGNKFAKWLREEFAPRMLIEHIEDSERLERIQDEGRRRILPDVYRDPLWYLPKWKYWAEWEDALPCQLYGNSGTTSALLNLRQLETYIFGRL
jgi:hypothetical protein